MNTTSTAEQQDFFSLFAQGVQEDIPVQSPTVQKTAEKSVAAIIAKVQETATRDDSARLTFITRAHREVMRNNPFVQFFSQMSYEDIANLEAVYGKKIYGRSSNLMKCVSEQLYAAFSSVLTILTYERYEAVDSRFTKQETGNFTIIEENGTETEVTYCYSPCDWHHADNQDHVSFPNHRITFQTEKPSIISDWTGFYSHSFDRVPIESVSSFGDFIVKTLSEARDIQETIVFEGRIYEPVEPKQNAGDFLC